MKRKLFDLKMEIEKVRNEIKCKQQLYDELANIPEVKNYRKTADELEKAIKKKKLLGEEYLRISQSECSHSLWYLLSYESDSYECKIFWTCKCIECGKVEERRSKDFENVITGDGLFARYNRSKYSYDEVKKVYNDLVNVVDIDEKTNINENDIAKLLVKKYNVK